MNYYSIRIYIEKSPESINCCNLLNIADEISNLLSCDYDRLGYFLLHPDYDFKNLGREMINSHKNRKIFSGLEIPLLYYGKKDENPSSPTISFDLKEKHSMCLPAYSVEFHYPILETQCLYISIDVKASLLSKKISMADFVKIQEIIRNYGYEVNSAIMHYYWGNARRVILDGGEEGFITINDWRIIDHGIKFCNDWKDKLFDVFLMNSIKTDIISQEVKRKIIDIVGKNNTHESDGILTFGLSQSPIVYLLNRYITTYSRRKIKKILQDENVCDKDASILHSILRL